MRDLSEISAMVVPQEPIRIASIPSQGMSSARPHPVEDVEKLPMVKAVATDFTATSKVSARPGEAKASTTNALIAAATSKPFVLRSDVRPGTGIMTDGQVAKSVQMPDNKPLTEYLKKWKAQLGREEALERWYKSDHSSVIPSKEDSDLLAVIK